MMALRALGWTLYTLAASALAGLFVVALGGPVTVRPIGIDAMALRFDLASAVLLVLILGVGAVVAGYSTRHLGGEPRVGQYAAGLAGAVFGLTLAVTALALPLLWIGWVAATWSLIALVSWRHTTEAARRPARYVAAWLAAGDLILLGGLVFLAAVTGTTDRGVLSAAVAGVPGPQIAAIAALLAAAGVIRSALIPAHRWLPETAAAPTPVSALLHAGIVNGAGILAVLLWPVFAAAPVVLVALVLIGAASILVATAIAAVRPDVKGRLAASTSAQMGFMTIQVGLGAPAAALFHLIGHGFYKGTLFLGAGSGVNALRRGRTAPADAGTQRAGRVRLVVSALVPATVVIVVASTVTPPLHGVGTAVLYAAAIATAAVLIYRAIDPAFQTPVGLRAVAVAGVAGLLTTYLVALFAFESALTPVIGATSSALPEPVLLALVLLLLGLGALGVVVDRRARAGRAPAIVVRAVAAAMSPRGGKRHVVPTAKPTAPITPVERARARASVAAASDIVAPAWPLGQFVASNPLAGLEHLPFDVATQRAARLRGGAVALSTTHFQRLYAAGEISDSALVASILERIDTLAVPPMLPRHSLVDLTRDLLITTDDCVPGTLQDAARMAVMSLGSRVANLLAGEGATLTIAGVADRDRGTALDDHIADAVAAWLAYLLADDDVRWSAPKGSLFARWRALAQSASVDRAMRADGFAAGVAALPERADESVAHHLASMGIRDEEWSEYLAATFARLPGWASHVAWLERESGSATANLLDLAAIHLSVERLIVAARSSAASEYSSAADALPENRSDGLLTTTERAIAHLERVARSGALDADSLRSLDDVALITLLRYAEGLHQAAPQIWRAAHEASFRDPLVAELAGWARVRPPEAESGPDVQAVFCIDVRSEPLRRRLEAAGSVYTLGFAGFFAVPFTHTSLAAACSTAQCPVLLTPRHGIHEVAGPQHHTMAQRALTGARARRLMSASTTAAQKAPNAPYSFAESAGWLMAPITVLRTASPRAWFALRRATREIVQPSVPTRQTIDETRDGLGFSPDEQVFLAEAALRTMGLTRDFARLVMISGHGSHTENNPFEAAYDCGACGGNSGGVNARALATILNSDAVRGRLAQVGIDVPATTWFLPAEHDTTVDTVTFLDADQVPTSHWQDVAALRVILDRTTLALSEQRISTLPDAPKTATPAAARRHVERRAADWAQTRPEWGLAGNAAFIVGDRSITERCDLGGRAFLHSYRWQDDDDGAALEVILTAPMVVAEWINTQYYFSSVDPDHFGSGSKVLHNLVGRIGVLSGPRGDLKPGLPLQAVAESVDSGDVHLRHQPLRLMTVIQAPLESVAAVVARNPVLQTLFGNEWVSLVVLDPANPEPQRYQTGGEWRPWFAHTAPDSGPLAPAVDLSHSTNTTIGATA